MIERTIRSQILYKGKFLDFMEDHVEIEVEPPMQASRQYFVHPGGVCVVPIIDDQIALIKQFRSPVGEIIYEIPAGKLDGKEDPFQAAKRELQEETGYSSTNWIDLGFIYPCPGYSTERLYIYLALDLVAGDQQLDHGEFVELEMMPLKHTHELIHQGQIPDAKTIAALFLAQRYVSL
ncbi:MAG: NUDIX hydrolase [Candidatus Melainabacteria bacterium]|nr:NUDIX hydrolase [Candidatus Melainabacteria bacterium]